MDARAVEQGEYETTTKDDKMPLAILPSESQTIAVQNNEQLQQQ
jgi:hypothetical protein